MKLFDERFFVGSHGADGMRLRVESLDEEGWGEVTLYLRAAGGFVEFGTRGESLDDRREKLHNFLDFEERMLDFFKEGKKVLRQAVAQVEEEEGADDTETA